MIVDQATNVPVAGFKYDMEPAEVIEWCSADDA